MAESSSQIEPASSSPAVDTIITLQVGERRFFTTSETLQESGFFSALLSGRWDNVQKDGSYFIDADPGIFEHILHYLRRGLFPLFHDNVRGYDYALYLALLGEAKHFQIPRLEKWIDDESYLKAFTVTDSITVVTVGCSAPETSAANTKIDYYPFCAIEKIYFCPDGHDMHDRCPNICIRDCGVERKRSFEENHIPKVTMIRRTSHFHPNIFR